MPGIAGLIALDIPRPMERLRAMLAFLTPAEGHQYNNAFVGATAAATTPSCLATIDGRLMRTNNLVQALKERHVMPATDDNELVAQGYTALGEELFPLLEGDFAILIVDPLKRQLFVLCDRVGNRDLFWAETAQGVLFATQLKSLLASGLLSSTLQINAIPAYLCMGYVSQDKTPIAAVSRLLPGYFLKITFDGLVATVPFWSYSSSFQRRNWSAISSSEDVYEALYSTMGSTVAERQRLSPSCPAVLKGSVGSALIEQWLRNPSLPYVPALTVEWTMERSTRSHAMGITPELFLDSLIPTVWAMELPIANVNLIRSWHWMRWCHSHNLTPFTDTGFAEACSDHAGELARCEAETYPHKVLPACLQLLGKPLFRLGSTFLPKLFFRWLRACQPHDPRALTCIHHGLMGIEELKWLAPAVCHLWEPDLFLRGFYHLGKIASQPASLWYLALKTYVVDGLHTPLAKLAAACGCPLQAPYLDRQLLELLARFPDRVWASPDILQGFPHYAVERSGVDLGPLSSSTKVLLPWMAHKGVQALFQSLEHGMLVESGLVATAAVRELLTQRTEHAFEVLYALVVLEIWMRLFVDLPLSPGNVDIPLHDLLAIPNK